MTSKVSKMASSSFASSTDSKVALYTFDESSFPVGSRKPNHISVRGRTTSSSSENGSLTYSVGAGSSNSGNNSTGNGSKSSIDTSFAENIAQILDDTVDVSALLKRDSHIQSLGNSKNSNSNANNSHYYDVTESVPSSTDPTSQRQRFTSSPKPGSCGSVMTSASSFYTTDNRSTCSGAGDRSLAAGSLAYSTDAESSYYAVRSLQTDAESGYLHGTDLLSTFTGHNSDVYGYTGEGQSTVEGHAFQRTKTSGEIGSKYQTNANFVNAKDYDYNDDPEGNTFQNQQLHLYEQPDIIDDCLFSPAEYADGIKRRKETKRRQRREERNKQRIQSQRNVEENIATTTTASSSLEQNTPESRSDLIAPTNDYVSKSSNQNLPQSTALSNDIVKNANSDHCADTTSHIELTTSIRSVQKSLSVVGPVPCSQESSASSSVEGSDAHKDDIRNRINKTRSTTKVRRQRSQTSTSGNFIEGKGTNDSHATEIPWWMFCFPEIVKGIITAYH